MEEIQWGQKRPGLSWHIFKTFTRAIGGALSICGRKIDANSVVDERPGDEKTCELCLRKVVDTDWA